MACAPACFPDGGPLCASTPILSSDPAWQEALESSATLSRAAASALQQHQQAAAAAAAASGEQSYDSIASSSKSSSVALAPPRLSSRGEAHAAKVTPFWNTFDCMLSDGFNASSNREGIVNMGIANNSLMETELLDHFHRSLRLDPIDLTYGSSLYGSTRLFAALCAHFNGPAYSPVRPIEPCHMVTGPGCGPLLDQLFEHLADEGEGVLCAAPYYNGFDADLATRSRVRCIPVHSPFGDGTEPDSFEGEAALRGFEPALLECGVRVRAVLVCNPNNPVGRCYDRAALLEYGRFAARHGLHLVFDEIYSLSTFSTSDCTTPQRFISALSIDWAAEAGLHPGSVHVLTSASKDFGINGFRLGTFISQANETLVAAMKMTGKLYMVSAPADALFSALLSDTAFYEWFTSVNRLRLSAAYELVRAWCAHHGIEYVPSNAGHFVLVNLAPHLRASLGEGTSAGAITIAPREAESLLWARMLDHRVCVTPGLNYHHPTPGWFRLTFALKRATVLEGLARLETALGLEAWSPPQPHAHSV